MEVAHRVAYGLVAGDVAVDLERVTGLVAAHEAVAERIEPSRDEIPETPVPRTSNGDIATPRLPNDEHGAVLVTGICGRLGRVLARVLHPDAFK